METEYGALEGYGEALAQLCRGSKLTITEIARRAGVTRGQLHKAFSGEGDLSVRTLGRVLTALNKSLIDLAEEIEIQSGHGPSAEQRELIRRLLIRLGPPPSES